eukprot:scaffold54413_cov22-Prasinocladus_malaysianus.AAC.1
MHESIFVQRRCYIITYHNAIHCRRIVSRQDEDISSSLFFVTTVARSSNEQRLKIWPVEAAVARAASYWPTDGLHTTGIMVALCRGRPPTGSTVNTIRLARITRPRPPQLLAWPVPSQSQPYPFSIRAWMTRLGSLSCQPAGVHRRRRIAGRSSQDHNNRLHSQRQMASSPPVAGCYWL